MIKQIKSRLCISQTTKVKIFKGVNTFLFCRVLRFHLPTLGPKGVTCIICDKTL